LRRQNLGCRKTRRFIDLARWNVSGRAASITPSLSNQLELIAMSLKEPNRVAVSSSRLRPFDVLIGGYVSWREASAAVTATYENWERVPPDERARAYAAYVTALDSEERAASAYQRLAEQAPG
jgi:hypothetical protein